MIKGWKNSKTLISQAEYDALEERDRKGKYSLDKIESYFTLCRKHLDPQVKPFVSRGGITSRKVRFYDFRRVLFSSTRNSKKMSVSKPRGRGKSHQGFNLHWHEQPVGKG